MQRKSVYNILLPFLALIFFNKNIAAQQFLSPFQPEQDACNALVVCTDSFVVPYSYQGKGLVTDLISSPCSSSGPMGDPRGGGEENSLWLKVKIAVSGILVFTIRPNNPLTDNYDFSVFDVTNQSCDQLSGANVIRCNYNALFQTSNGPGQVGLNLISPHLFIPWKTIGSSFCRYIDAEAGDEYLILINMYGPQLSPIQYGPGAGFTIDFTGSTTTFVKGNPPQMDSVELKCPNRARVFLDMNKPIKCSSIDSHDFVVNPDNPDNPTGVIYSAKGIGCDMNNSGFTDQIQINFSNILPPGEYTLKAQNGNDGNTLFDMCDEPLPLPASVHFLVPDLDDTLSRTVCPNQIPYPWNNMSVSDTGNNIAHFVSPNFLGCDSNTVLNLFVSDTLRDTVNLRICPGQLPYTWNGVKMADTGMHAGAFYTLAEGGCDSAVSINLFALYPKLQDTTIHSCGVFSLNNQDYVQSQIILDTVQSVLGCDSLYRTIHLMVHPEIIPTIMDVDTAGCGFVLFEDQVYIRDQTITDTLYSRYGCDSVYRNVHIIVYPNTQPVKLWDTIAHCDEVVYEGRIYHSDTTLTQIYTNRAGCDSLIHIIRIRVDTLSLVLTANPPVPVKDDYLVLSTTAKNAYTITAWKPAALFPNQQALEQHLLMPAEQQTFAVFGISERGCVDSVSLYIKPDSLIPELVIPTAFTPNGDGLNDVFRPEFVNRSGHIVRDFKIYNRLGQLVFKQFTDKTAAWDGTIGEKKKPASMGTYFYFIEVKFVNGKETKLKGEVTLIR